MRCRSTLLLLSPQRGTTRSSFVYLHTDRIDLLLPDIDLRSTLRYDHDAATTQIAQAADRPHLKPIKPIHHLGSLVDRIRHACRLRSALAPAR
jgi:hypothetical protein